MLLIWDCKIKRQTNHDKCTSPKQKVMIEKQPVTSILSYICLVMLCYAFLFTLPLPGFYWALLIGRTGSVCAKSVKISINCVQSVSKEFTKDYRKCVSVSKWVKSVYKGVYKGVWCVKLLVFLSQKNQKKLS